MPPYLPYPLALTETGEPWLFLDTRIGEIVTFKNRGRRPDAGRVPLETPRVLRGSGKYGVHRIDTDRGVVHRTKNALILEILDHYWRAA